MNQNRVKQKTTWQKVRKLFNDVHLWMGIGSGIILFVVCLTGTIYTFSTEIQEKLEPKKFWVTIPSNAKMLSAEVIEAKVSDSFRNHEITGYVIPADKSRSWQVTVKAKKSDAGDRGTTYLVNPYTGQILGETKGAGSEFFMTIFKLHRWLLLDTETGRPIVGWATVLFTLLCISGLVIWVPQKAKMWKQGLKLKLTGNWKRNNHDLHNTLGFYAAIPLIVMGLTGLTWSFEWYNDAFRKMCGTYKPKDAPKERPVESTFPENGMVKTLLIADFLRTADSILPYSGDYRITPAKGETGIVAVSKTRHGFFAPAAGDRLQLDQYSAAALKVDIFKEKKFGERISGSVKALHVGNVYGTFSKILYFICCLIATSLPVTGTIIWINKLKKKRKKNPLEMIKENEVVEEVV